MYKLLKTLMIVIVFGVTNSSSSHAQSPEKRSKENTRGIQKVLESLENVPGLMNTKFKSAFDKGIVFSEHQLMNEDGEWVTFVEKKYVYSNNRKNIEIQLGAMVDNVFQVEETYTAILNEAGLLKNYTENYTDDNYVNYISIKKKP